jgi:trimeric autotransporter adhesin
MRTVVRSVLYGVLAAVLVMATTLGVHAQSSQGSLRGVVKDVQGVIPGVTVVLLNQANNVARDTITNGSGEYSFPAVEPGTYTVTAAVPGFKTFKQAGVQINTQ